MPYKKPKIPTFDLRGIDAKIQDLQAIVANLAWLDYSFGVCEHAKRQENEEMITYPAQWINNRTDYIDLRPFPADIYNYAFWNYADPAEVQYNNDQLQYSKRQYAHYQYDVACIFVTDMSRVDNANTYNETKSRMRQDIVNILETNLVDIGFHFWITEIIEKDIQQIFDPFVIDKPDEWKYPYQAFRINANILFKRECPVYNNYSRV